MDVTSWWVHLTEGQGLLLSALATLASAFVVALLGPAVLGSRFRTLDETVLRLREQSEAVQRSLDEIRGKVRDLDTLIGALQQSVSANTNAMTDITEQLAPADADPDAREQGAPPDPRERFRKLWFAIRNRLEQIASAPELHPQTRAKYARLDRRDSGSLLRALLEDENLPSSEAWVAAERLWRSKRFGRAVRPTDLAEMERLAEALGVSV